MSTIDKAISLTHGVVWVLDIGPYELEVVSSRDITIFFQTQSTSFCLSIYQKDFYFSNHQPPPKLFLPSVLFFSLLLCSLFLSLFLCLSLWFDFFFLLFSEAKQEPEEAVRMVVVKRQSVTLSTQHRRQTHPLCLSGSEGCPPTHTLRFSNVLSDIPWVPGISSGLLYMGISHSNPTSPVIRTTDSRLLCPPPWEVPTEAKHSHLRLWPTEARPWSYWSHFPASLLFN